MRARLSRSRYPMILTSAPRFDPLKQKPGPPSACAAAVAAASPSAPGCHARTLHAKPANAAHRIRSPQGPTGAGPGSLPLTFPVHAGNLPATVQSDPLPTRSRPLRHLPPDFRPLPLKPLPVPPDPVSYQYSLKYVPKSTTRGRSRTKSSKRSPGAMRISWWNLDFDNPGGLI
jgi:hypothetical protein